MGRVLLAVGVLATGASARAAALTVFVAVPEGLSADGLAVEVEGSDGIAATPLRDDGAVAHDIPGDRIFTATVAPRSGRTTDVVLLDGDGRPLYAGPVRIDDPRWSSVAFTLRRGPEGPVALRVPTSWPGGAVTGDSDLPLVAAAAWGLLGVGLVGVWLAGGRRRGARARGARGGS